MKASEIFKYAVRFLLEETKTKRSVLADSTKIPRPHLTAYLNGDRGFSEDKRDIIAAFFGNTYLEMLLLGHQLATGIVPVAPEILVDLREVISKLESMNQQDLKLMNDMATRLTQNIGDD